MTPTTRTLLLLSFLGATSACSQTDPGDAGAPAPVPAASVTQSPGRSPAPVGFAYSPLPAGLVMTKPYQVRLDRVYTNKDGVERRHSTLELLEGDAGSVKDALVSQLETRGFHVMDRPQKGDGIVRTGLVHPRAGRINLSSSDQVGDKPANPHAVGLVSLDWPMALVLDQNMAAAPNATH